MTEQDLKDTIIRQATEITRNLIHKQRYTRDKLQDMSLEIANLKTALESEIEDTENLMTGIKMHIERLEKLY